jgi:glutamate-5-semialdehyde dehydrogenase
VLIEKNSGHIIRENKSDLDRMDDSNPKKDRLMLNEQRIKDLAKSLLAVSALSDPAGRILSAVDMENGLHIEKRSVPVGVVGVIYESRPNVTVDVAALCLMAGNAVILRGGSDAIASNAILVTLIKESLQMNGFPSDTVNLLSGGREQVKELMEADKLVDMIIPRGSQELIDFVRRNSRVPVIETGAGVCHTYVSDYADLNKAVPVVINAKVSRPSVCNALDTILVHRSVARNFLPAILEGFQRHKVEIYADEEAFGILRSENYLHLKPARPEDFGREFLSYACSVKVVSSLNEALEHIRKHSSRHSEAIISENKEETMRFMEEVDAAAVYTNASTRFTDGGCFGLGAEVGISTQKLHARGPFALEKLVTEKWFVMGNGQVRE